MATINYNNVFDSIIEAWQCTDDYYRACAHYYKKHGFHACLDYKYGLDYEKRTIMWKSNWKDQGDSTINALVAALFNNDCDQTRRLFIATRALHRWYERTNWQYIPDSELIDRLARFVEG